MLLRLVTLALAQTLDLVTFWLMIGRHGPAAEANPLAVQILAGGGMPTIVALKIALIVLIGSLGVAASVHVGRRAWAIAGGLPVALAIAFGLVGGISNAAVLLS